MLLMRRRSAVIAVVGSVVVAGNVGTLLRGNCCCYWAAGGYVNVEGGVVRRLVNWVNERGYVCYDGNGNARAQVRGYACLVNWNGRVRGRGGSCECVRCHCYDGHVSQPCVGARYGLCCAVLPHSHRARNQSWVTVLI